MSAVLSVTVTGANGRLGRALMASAADAGAEAIAWSRPDYDLDDPRAAAEAFRRDRSDVVIHSAAWTDVDGCALDPDAALRRNSEATAELATACAEEAARLVLISTNEVFDGRRTDGLGYVESDPPRPINAYGSSKLSGEIKASEAFQRAGRGDDLLIVRTAWLFGPPGNDFPSKILAAADRLSPTESLKVVSDEVGSPTYTADLADAVIRLVMGNAPGGVYHGVNVGRASRLELAQRVLAACRPERATAPISRKDIVRASSPPAWAVLDTGRPAVDAMTLRPWQDAIDDYLSMLCPA